MVANAHPALIRCVLSLSCAALDAQLAANLPAIRCHCGLNVAPSADMMARILLPLLALLPFP